MSTNFRIGYPDIPFNALTLTPIGNPSGTEDTWLTLSNTIAGPKHTRYATNVAVDTFYVDYDLGWDYATLQSQADYFYVGQLALTTINANLTLSLQYSTDDGSTYTNASTVTSSAPASVGFKGRDYLTTFTQTSTYRRWRVYTQQSSGTAKFICSKIMFGAGLDLGVYPDYTTKLITRDDADWFSDSGARWIGRNTEPRYQIDLKWVGVSDANAKSFIDKIVRNAHRWNYLLYTTSSATTSQQAILDSKTCLYSKLLDHQVTRSAGIDNWNTITASFIEDVG